MFKTCKVSVDVGAVPPHDWKYYIECDIDQVFGVLRLADHSQANSILFRIPNTSRVGLFFSAINSDVNTSVLLAMSVIVIWLPRHQNEECVVVKNRYGIRLQPDIKQYIDNRLSVAINSFGREYQS